MMKNIVQRYFENNKNVPFIVRRVNWPRKYGMLVITVKPKKTPSGWYGEVYGYPLPALDGSPANLYWGETGKVRKVKNSGSYQWNIVKDIPKEWESYLTKTS